MVYEERWEDGDRNFIQRRGERIEDAGKNHKTLLILSLCITSARCCGAGVSSVLVTEYSGASASASASTHA